MAKLKLTNAIAEDLKTAASDSFIDSYATVSPSEDRARVMEYAMLEFNAFWGHDNLTEKLRFYCSCIRDAFDTTNWPNRLPWEQYL